MPLRGFAEPEIMEYRSMVMFREDDLQYGSLIIVGGSGAKYDLFQCAHRVLEGVLFGTGS